MISWKNRIDLWYYLQGWYRYRLFYSNRYEFLIRKHILEQIDYRIYEMDIECYEAGECKKCGCATTALQMANKSCLGECYPVMMSKSKWNKSSERLRYLVYITVNPPNR